MLDMVWHDWNILTTPLHVLIGHALTNFLQYRVTRRPGAIALATKLTGIRGSPLPFARGVYTCRIPGANGGTQTLYAGVKLGKNVPMCVL